MLKDVIKQARYYVERGDWQQAKRILRKAHNEHLNDRDINFELACLLLADGDAYAASQILDRLVLEHDTDTELLSKLGVAYAMLGKTAPAIVKFNEAIKYDPSYMPAYNNLALALWEGGDIEDAREVAEKGLQIDASYLPIYSVLAKALKHLGRIDEAADCLQKAIVLDPDSVSLLHDLAGIFLEKGQSTESRSILQRVLELSPEHLSAHYLLSLVKNYESCDDQHIKDMERLLADDRMPIEDRATLCFALGKAYEDTEKFENSFSYYKKGNYFHRCNLDYSIDVDRNLFRQIKAIFTASFIKENTVDPANKTPIFILGMPRSGTSLVEQVLACHPDIYAAGELNWLEKIQSDLPGPDYVRKMQSLTGEAFKAFAERYLQRSGSFTENKTHFTDKMPLNFRYIGLIKCLFPNAKVVHCMRQAEDTCFSIFKKKFSGNISFAYNLIEIGEYYCLYESLMAHWHTVLPDFIYDLSYEKFVESPERETRRVLEFCGLPWTEACLEFHKNQRPVLTASTLQVREPVYKSSVDYWKNYEPFLAELISVLQKCPQNAYRSRGDIPA